MQNMKLEDYLREDKLAECNKWYDALQHYLATCNHYLFFLERIDEFDNTFGFWVGKSFWPLTSSAYFDAFLGRFYALVADKDSRSMTLPAFYTFLYKNAKDDQTRNIFINNFDKRNFDDWVIDVRSKLEILRNKFTAHLDQEYLTSVKNRPKFSPLSLTEMRLMIEQAQIYFSSMSFNARRSLWFADYVEEKERMEHVTEIDELLDTIAVEAFNTTAPDKYPDKWAELRPTFTGEQIIQINRVRRKMGLPDVE